MFKREDGEQSRTELILLYIYRRDFLSCVTIRNMMITIRNMLSMTSTSLVLQCKTLLSLREMNFVKGEHEACT